MSLDLQKQIWNDPEPKGAALLVLLCLASYVDHERWERGEDLLAWPSQLTIARRCNCSRSTVERALADLQELGKIADTGKRKTRRTIEWEIYPSTAPVVQSGAELAELVADMPDDGARQGHMPDGGACEENVAGDMPHPGRDLPHPAQRPAPSCSINLPRHGAQEIKERLEQQRDKGEMTARAGARASGQVFDRDGLETQEQVEAGEHADALAALWSELGTATGAKRERILRQLDRNPDGDPPTAEREIAMWASRPLTEAVAA